MPEIPMVYESPSHLQIFFYHIVRFKREEAKILARENREKAKAEAEIWRAEVCCGHYLTLITFEMKLHVMCKH